MNNDVSWDEGIRTARTSITPSGYFGNSKDNIVELENIITEEDLKLIDEFDED